MGFWLKSLKPLYVYTGTEQLSKWMADSESLDIWLIVGLGQETHNVNLEHRVMPVNRDVLNNNKQQQHTIVGWCQI